MIAHKLKGKPVLVTGGTGFIGCNLVKGLLDVGAEVYVLGGNGSRGSRRNLEDVGFEIREGVNYFTADLRSEEDCRKVIKDMHTIYHLAATIGGIAYILEHGLDVWKNNTLIDANVFQAVINHSGVENFIYTSTACVYPLKMSKTTRSLHESDAWKGETHSVYGGTKLVAEKALRMHVQNKNVQAMIARFHNVYGPRSVMKGNAAQVIQALIARALNNPNQDLEIWGSGKQGRDFIYVTDVVDWLVNVFYTKDGTLPQEPVQRGSGVNTNILEVAQAILAVLNSNAKVIHKPVPDEGEEGRIADNSKFEELYPDFSPALSIQEGIKRYIEWALPREAWWKVEDKVSISLATSKTAVGHLIEPKPSANERKAEAVTASLLKDELTSRKSVKQPEAAIAVSTQVRHSSNPVKRLGTYLVEAGLLTPEQVELALNKQKGTTLRFGEVLSQLGWVQQKTIEYMVAKVILPEQQLDRQAL